MILILFKIYDNELIKRKGFESNCRRILNIMLLFIQSDNYTFFNPCKIPLQKIIDYLKIQQFQNDTLTNADAFEIDIVINDFKVSDLQKLIKNYRTHFFFDDKLNLENCKLNEKVNFKNLSNSKPIMKHFLSRVSALSGAGQGRTHFLFPDQIPR